MDAEWDVLQLVQAVCDGDASEDEVYRISSHILVSQDQNIDNIEYATKNRNDKR